MQVTTKVSVEEYLLKEKEAEGKSEYHNGEIVAMAGAKEPHNVIVSNLIIELGNCLKKYNCRLYSSNMLLKLEKCNKYVYPDLMIVCEKPALENYAGLDALLNPLVIIEVLSESTKNYDHSEKMNCYLELESLTEYIMVDSEEVSFASYKKTENRDWLFKTIKNIEEKVVIFDCEIALQDIYRNVDFEEKK